MKNSTRKLLGLKSIRKPTFFKSVVYIFGLNAKRKANDKRKVLEKKQDNITMKELDNTIGKSLGIK